MPRKSIGVLVLTGITLSGALGGQMMRSGARLPRRDAPGPVSALPLRGRPALPPVPVPVAPSAAAQERVDVARDVFALAGD